MGKYAKKSASVLCAALTLCMSFSGFVGCNFGIVDDPNAEEIDPSRTQLYVFNYKSGFGSQWIDDIKVAYETLNANTIYEPGVTYNGQQKKGVQVMVTSLKEEVANSSNMDDIPDRTQEVYFTEFSYYYDLYNGGKDHDILGDITGAVTGDLSKRYVGYDESGALINGDGLEDYAVTARETAGSTIYGKMTETQRNYFNIDGKYYAVPHYAGYYGLTYNVDLFDEEGYYFAASENTDDYDFALAEEGEMDVEDWFINADNPTKSAGPDGEAGNDDDGLPATYKEFFMLCQYMLAKEDTPIIWGNNAANSYLNALLQALAVDHDGLKNTMVTYDMAGTIDNLVDVTFDAKGNATAVNPENQQSMTIAYDDGNAWNVSRSAGRYYALQFMQALINGQYGKKDNNNKNVGYYKEGASHISAQTDYVATNVKGKEDIGMLVDGIWWENEAVEAFTYAASDQHGANAVQKKDCDFKFMPLPHASKAEIGQKRTVLDTLYSLCFMKKNIDPMKKPIAIDFIKFVNTHDQLVKFTQTTNTVKSLEYTLTPDEKETLTTFGKSVVNMREGADVVYPYATHARFKRGSTLFYYKDLYCYSGTQEFVFEQMYAHETTGLDYFKNMVSYYRTVPMWTAGNDK